MITPPRFSFDDERIGLLSNTGKTIKSSLIPRPRDLNKKDWYEVAGKACSELNKWVPGENDLTKLAKESEPSLNPLDPKGAAGALKPQLQLIPTVAMQEEAKALADGKVKYGENNWRTNKVCASTYVGAILRHITAYRDGEDVDPESKSGVSHLGSVRACCAILLDAMKHGTLVDDRPEKPITES